MDIDAATTEMSFPDSSDFAYPDSSETGDDAAARACPGEGDARNDLITPEPFDKETGSLPKSTIQDHDSERKDDELDDNQDATPDTPASKSFSISLLGNHNIIGHISTDDSGFCLSSKDEEMEGDKGHDEVSTDANNLEGIHTGDDDLVSSKDVNGDDRESPPDEISYASEVPLKEAGAEVNSDTVIDAVSAPDVVSAAEEANVIDDAEYADSDRITDVGTDNGTRATTSQLNDPQSSASDNVTSTPNDGHASESTYMDYVDSDKVTDIDDGDVKPSFTKEDSKVETDGQAGASPNLDPNHWREFPLVLVGKEGDVELPPFSPQDSKPDTDRVQRSRQNSSTASTPDIPERCPTPNWSTDGNNVLDSFDDLISLLPCDLRGWAIHKSECGGCLALVHTQIEFKTLELRTDVVVVFERELPKMKK